MEFGESDFKGTPIGDFQGDLDLPATMFDNLAAKAILTKDLRTEKHYVLRQHVSAVDSRDARLNHLYARVMTDKSHDSHLDLQ